MIPKKKSELEFIALMASLMSLVALSIDTLLPALEKISLSVGIHDVKENQLLITMIFLGLGFGQLFFGPISDSLGRKPVIYIGFSIFILASLLCVSTTSIEGMVIGRILQGIGLAAPRTISIAMVRDKFSGNHMAKIMSFVVIIFILMPIIAPAIGKVMLDLYGWRFIFYSQLFFGSFIILWLWKRQPETLPKEKRKKLTISLFVEGTKEFVKHKDAVAFTIMSGLITGSFMVYLSASQQIFQLQYHLADEFPYIFAGLAVFIGFATFLNGVLVMKLGMKKLTFISSLFFTIVPLIYILFFHGETNPNIFVLLVFFGLQFSAIGFLFGNDRALAMQSVGHIAGIGSAINGFVSTVMAVPIAAYIGSFVSVTAFPLFVGFFISGVLTLLIFYILKRQDTRALKS